MPRRETVVGLDIGRHAAKAVWAELRSGKVAVTRAESLRLPPQTAITPDVIEPWIAKTGIARTSCVIGLSGEHVMFQPFTLPAADPRTPEQAAAMELVKFNELAAEPMSYGYAPFSVRPGERRLLMSIIRHSLLDQALDSARGLGLDIIDVVPQSVALFNALASGTADQEEPCLFVDIGHSTTNLAVSLGCTLVFARSFPSGGQMFTDAIARARNCSATQAESIKITQGSLMPGDPQILAALSSIADLWVTEAQACLSVYNNLFPDRQLGIRRGIVAGGAAALPGLPEFLSQRLNFEITKTETLPGTVAVERPWEYTTAAGLAISGLNAGATQLSLLPQAIKDQLMFRKQKPFWIAAAAVAALILAASLAGGYRDFRRKEQRLGIQKRSLTRRQELAAQIEAVKAGSEHIRSMAAPVSNLLKVGPAMREVISTVAACKGTNDWITMICDAESYFNPDPMETADSRPGRPGIPGVRSPRSAPRPNSRLREDGTLSTALESLIIEGYTRRSDLSTVKKLIADLAQCDPVASADLLSDDKLIEPSMHLASSGGRNAQRFVLDVRLKTP